MERMKRRMVCIVVVISVLLTGLAVRVYSIQILQGPVYKAMARSQQRIALSGVDSRGEICDRSGEPLTGARLEYVYILQRDRVELRTGAKPAVLRSEVSRLLEQIDARERRTSNEKYRIFTAEKYEKDIAEKLRMEHGAYLLQIPQRYQEDQPAVYLLGYVRSADNVGMTGLEAAYDEYLSQRDKVIYGVADASNRIINGYGIQNTQEREVQLVTTLDKRLQERVEDIVNRVEEGRACAIVTDVATGDILTCATSPGFDPMMVEELLQSEHQELLDIALQGMYPPGSVFKIIVAAAALEDHVISPETVFLCDGAEEFGAQGEVVVSCTAKEGHGELTMKEAFAHSCNCAFIQMGQAVGAEKILDMAQRLGFGREVLRDLNMENPGNLPSEEEVVGAGIANLSIGQGSLLVTPLQVAQMTQILAAGGMDTGLWLTELQERREPQRILSEATAADILDMMRGTVEFGTAKRLCDWDCGGKTGSAEGFLDGAPAVHAWFTGVVPTSDPQFTVTVFVEGGGLGSRSAVPVFEDILEVLE